MMGHREALNSGDEVDAVGSHRHDHHWRPGERKAIKRQLGKRARRRARLALGVSLAALRGFTGGETTVPRQRESEPRLVAPLNARPLTAAAAGGRPH
jgi:hypothetical protein